MTHLLQIIAMHSDHTRGRPGSAFYILIRARPECIGADISDGCDAHWLFVGSTLFATFNMVILGSYDTNRVRLALATSPGEVRGHLVGPTPDSRCVSAILSVQAQFQGGPK